ncbi:hypothetical protein [Aurantivibrio plasticivorans]
MRRLILSCFSLLIASAVIARPVSDTTTLDGDESFVLVKLSSDSHARFATLSLVRWEDERISTSLAEYYSLPTNGEYVLIKQSLAGTFYPYNINDSKRDAQGRKMVFGKTLKGSLVEGEQAQYRYTLTEGKINYIGDITVEPGESGQHQLTIQNQIEAATRFVQTHYPSLFEHYVITDALMTINSDSETSD